MFGGEQHSKNFVIAELPSAEAFGVSFFGGEMNSECYDTFALITSVAIVI